MHPTRLAALVVLTLPTVACIATSESPSSDSEVATHSNADSILQAREVAIWSCQSDLSRGSADVQIVISKDDKEHHWGLFYRGRAGSKATALDYSERFAVQTKSQGDEVTYLASDVTDYPLVGNHDQTTKVIHALALRGGASSTLTLDGEQYQLTCTVPNIPITAADCPMPPTKIAPTGEPIPVSPKGTGPCDDTTEEVGFSMTGYVSHGDYVARDDTDQIQKKIDEAVPGQLVSLAAGTYCVTKPLELPRGVRIEGAASHGDGATTIEVPAAVVWSNWCSDVCPSGNHCPERNHTELTCPKGQDKLGPFWQKFVFHSSGGAQQVSIAHLRIHGNSEVFYAESGPLYDHYHWNEAPNGLSVDNNCNGGHQASPGWVAGVAGGISIGDYWSIDDVHLDSMVHWGLQDRSSGATISNSTSSGPTCNDGIGGAGGGRGRSGNGKPFLLGADMGYGCPGAHVANHTWTSDFRSSSSAMDMMDTVGVELIGSTNRSNNHVTLEGVRDALIQGNTFTGAGDLVLHANEEYAWNDYYQSGGVEFEALTLSTGVQVLDNTFRGGSAIRASFAAVLVSVPFGGADGVPLPVAPYLAGPTVLSGNTIDGALTAGILWNGSDRRLLGGAGIISDNVITNPVTCPKPMPSPPGSVGARCNEEWKHLQYGYKMSGLAVYNWADANSSRVRVEGNTITPSKWADPDCEIQGDFAMPPRDNVDGDGKKASECSFVPEGLDCGAVDVDKKTLTCKVRKD